MEVESEIKIEYNETYEQDPLSLYSNLKDDYFELHEDIYNVKYSSNIENVITNDVQIPPLASEDLHNHKPHTSVDKLSIDEINDKADDSTHSNSTHEENNSSNIEDVLTNDLRTTPLAHEEDFHNPHTSVNKLSIDESSDNADDSIYSDSIDNVKWYEVDDVGKYVCKFCNRTYSNRQTLRYHTLNKHPSEASTLENKTSRNRHSVNKCHICKIKFNEQQDLKNHMQDEHSIEKIHFCHKCKAEFTSFKCLCIHLDVSHKITANTIYSCLICGYKTVKWSHYDQHKKTHSHYKTHKCSYCNYTTNHSSNLRIHEQIHEKQSRKIYKCKYLGCQYSANTRCAMNSHKLKHEKNYLYCDKCTYKTVYNQSLKKHMDSHLRNTIKTI